MSEPGPDGQGPAPLAPIWDQQPPAWKEGLGLRVGAPDLGRPIPAGVRRVAVALGAEVVLRLGAPAPWGRGMQDTVFGPRVDGCQRAGAQDPQH